MAFFILSLLMLAASEDSLVDQADKYNACFYLTKLKFTLDQQHLDSLVGKFGNSDRIGNKISIDMIMKCYRVITIATAYEVLEQGTNLAMTDSYDELLKTDYEDYASGNFEFTEENIAFNSQIKKMKEDMEILADKAPVVAPPLPPANLWYIAVVLIVFVGLIYWASSKVLSKPQNNRKNKNKKKGN